MTRIVLNEHWSIVFYEEEKVDIARKDWFPLHHTDCFDINATGDTSPRPGLVFRNRNDINNFCQSCKVNVPKEIVDKCKFLDYGHYE